MIPNGIYNLDSTRFQKASLDTRSEGWTEIWGGKEEQVVEEEEGESKENKDDNKQVPNNKNERIVLVFEDTTNSMWAEVDDPSINVLLTQYRPAWLEQIVLKMANIPFIVVNSTHHCNEATGHLPFLTDYSACSGSGNCNQQQHNNKQQSKLPMLIGRHHPSNLIERHQKNSILAYLKEYRNVDIDEMGLTTDHQKALSQSFLNLIQTDLQNCLLYLRYEDHDAWEQVYRQQYIQASCPKRHYYQKQDKGDVHVNWFLQLRGRFQAMTERAVERRRLIEYTRNSMHTDDVIERAKVAYQALERQLTSANQGTARKEKYLLGTESPAFVDAALFAHLADALCDVHLVVVLSSYPNLVQYFQDTYQKYFSTNNKSKTNKRPASCWDEWNEQQNVENSFQQIPILAENQISKYSNFKDAIDLMHSLSLQKQELKEVLGAIKAKRDDEPWPKKRQFTDSCLYRWCLGGDMEKVTSKTTAEKEENPIRKKLLRDQIRNDQRWISGVAAASMVAILLLQAGGSDE
jgi:hypothetical protein